MFSITINDDLKVGEILFEKTEALSPEREKFLMEKAIPILQAFAQLISKSLERLKKNRAYKIPDEISEPKQDESMIELKIKLLPLPIVTNTIIHLDDKENVERGKRLYNELIYPLIRTHLKQLNKELAGMSVAVGLALNAKKKGLDIEEVFSNKKLRRKLWEGNEKE